MERGSSGADWQAGWELGQDETMSGYDLAHGPADSCVSLSCGLRVSAAHSTCASVSWIVDSVYARECRGCCFTGEILGCLATVVTDIANRPRHLCKVGRVVIGKHAAPSVCLGRTAAAALACTARNAAIDTARRPHTLSRSRLLRAVHSALGSLRQAPCRPPPARARGRVQPRLGTSSTWDGGDRRKSASGEFR